MPSTPKKRLMTGNAELGRELRRLRGVRRLHDVAEMSRRGPASLVVTPISPSTLSEIESAKTMPSVQTLASLAIIYGVSLNSLAPILLRRDGQKEPPAEGNWSYDGFGNALLEGRYYEALRMAEAAELGAQPGPSRWAWAANRASCLSTLGLHSDAAALYLAALEQLDAHPLHRAHCLHGLATCYYWAGLQRRSVLVYRESLALAIECSAADLVAVVRRDLAFLLVVGWRWGGDVNVSWARESLRLVADARCAGVAQEATARRLDVTEAMAFLSLGNRLIGERDLKAVLKVAGPDRELVSFASLPLAHSAERTGRPQSAVRILEDAGESTHAFPGDPQQFEVNYRLFSLLQDTRPGPATRRLRVCSELYPTLTLRNPVVEAYERTVKGRSWPT